MNETNLIIQNRLREATISLERANLIICDETWKCDSSVPPFSSIQLVLQGEGTVCIDETTIHPTSGQLYLLPAYTNQAFFTDIHNPYRTYYCHFEITCQQTDLFELIHLPLCIDAKDPKKAEQLFLDLVHSVRQDDIFSALKAKQAVLNLLCYYLECCPPDSVSLVAQTFDSSSSVTRRGNVIPRFRPFPAFSSSCRGREPSASMRQPSIQQADSCICFPPTRTRHFLPISIIHTAPTIAISRSPASRPTCSNSFICRSASTRKTRKRPNSFSSISFTASDRMISFLR